MPFPEQPPNVPEENPTGHLPAVLRDPARLGRAARRARLRRRRGRAARAGERRAGRDRQGLAHARRVRRHRPRPPQRPQRARRRRRPLVGRELRRGPGPVVARRASRATSASRREGVDPRRVRPRRGRRVGSRSTSTRRARSRPRSLDPRGRVVAYASGSRSGSRRAFARRACGRRRSRRSTRSSLERRGRDGLLPRRLPHVEVRDGGCSSTASRC